MSDELEVDLNAVAIRLDEGVPLTAREGFVMGRTAIRDQVVVDEGCSVVAAERLVDTLIARGLLRFEKDPRRLTVDQWVFRVDPSG